MPPSFDGRPRDAQQRGQTLQIVAFVTFGVAALAAGGGVVLYLLGNKIDREARRNSGRDLSLHGGGSGPTWSLAPTLSPGGGGLWAQGRF